ncbi:hypothetical protein [Kitasatospora sp. NPDC088783]|uniref:hypothetical protein n=1 Tax=Kitasatospora sp. NPDC088783 TaxID=3364077 RepID=UPI00382EA9C4
MWTDGGETGRPTALSALGLLLVPVAGVLATRSGSRCGSIAVLVVTLPLPGSHRAPVPECRGGRISRQDDGSSRCSAGPAGAYLPSYVPRSATAVKPTPYADTERP